MPLHPPHSTRRRVQEAGVLLGSPFHTDLFTACGKLPAAPRLELLRPLLASPAFTGCADDYVDARRSTILMYCVGPANDESLPMVTRRAPYPRLHPLTKRALPAAGEAAGGARRGPRVEERRRPVRPRLRQGLAGTPTRPRAPRPAPARPSPRPCWGVGCLRLPFGRCVSKSSDPRAGGPSCGDDRPAALRDLVCGSGASTVGDE